MLAKLSINITNTSFQDIDTVPEKPIKLQMQEAVLEKKELNHSKN